MGTKKNVRNSKSRSSKSRRNSILKSWVNFVKKVQKDEKISYSKAMSRASVRKSEWKRGGDWVPSAADGATGAPYDNGDGLDDIEADADAVVAEATADADADVDAVVGQTGAGKRRRRGGSKRKTSKRKTMNRRRGGKHGKSNAHKH